MSLAHELERLAAQTESAHRLAMAARDSAIAGTFTVEMQRQFESELRARLLDVHRVLQRLPPPFV